METYPTCTIRAACLYRMIKFINDNLQAKYPTEFLEPINQKSLEIDEHQILRDMIKHMNIEQSANPHFPTDNMDIMGKAIFKIIKWYKDYASLYSLIKALCLFNSLILPGEYAPRNARVYEIEILNEKFYTICAALDNIDEFEPCANLITPDEVHEFHPDSQFLSFTVSKINK